MMKRIVFFVVVSLVGFTDHANALKFLRSFELDGTCKCGWTCDNGQSGYGDISSGGGKCSTELCRNAAIGACGERVMKPVPVIQHK